MATQMTMTAKLAESAKAIGERYSAGSDQPLRGYTTTMITYSALVGALTAAARVSGKPVPSGLSPTDVVLAAAATHKLSRLLTKDPVTSPLRAPFTSFKGTNGPAELAEEPRGSGADKAIGELVTCPFCAEVWIGTGLTAGLVFLPRLTRLVMSTFAALTGADMLHFAHAWLARKVG